jgi:hypothetical protein
MKYFLILKDSNTHKYFDLKNKEFMVPYDLPPVEYALDDKPWVNDIKYDDLDEFGKRWNGTDN